MDAFDLFWTLDSCLRDLEGLVGWSLNGYLGGTGHGVVAPLLGAQALKRFQGVVGLVFVTVLHSANLGRNWGHLSRNPHQRRALFCLPPF